MKTGYYKQQGSSHIIFGRVFDILKNGGLKLIAVVICDGNISRAKQMSTKGCFPDFVEVTRESIPSKILERIDSKFKEDLT